MRQSQLGRKHSPETIEKIRQAHIGLHHTEETKMKLREARKCFIFTENHKAKIRQSKIGKKLSEETKNKISITKLGDRNAAWKGGVCSPNQIIRSSKKYNEFRRSIFIRDNFTCKECGRRGIRIQIHHIKSFSNYPDLRFNLDNIITLCFDCHRKTSNFLSKAKKEI